jgi:hypothetical protein
MPDRFSFEKQEKYLVIKIEDMVNALDDNDSFFFRKLVHKIRDYRVNKGKPSYNSYIVVNEDEPYSNKVWKLIANEERNKYNKMMKLKKGRSKTTCGNIK